MQPLDRGEEAPRAGPEIWVRRLVKNEMITFGCSSPSVWGFWIHWDPDRRKSEPCFANHKKCPGHQRDLARKWRGYVYGYNETCKRYEFLEITPATKEVLDQMTGFAQNLRGQRWTLKRGNADTARVKVVVLENLKGETLECLRPDLDPQATLMSLWGFEPEGNPPSAALAG